MVATVVENAPPPPDLVTAWQCDRWGCLPEDGAYYDQDFGLMRRITALSNVYSGVSRLRNSRGEQIHRLTESERTILGALVKEGLLFNG